MKGKVFYMSIKLSSYPVHLQDSMKLDREHGRLQENQDAERKVFHRDTVEISQLSKNREAVMDRMKHMVVQSTTSFSDTSGEILKEAGKEKGQYGYQDVVNACGLSYAVLYSEIEQRYEKEQEQYDKADGTLLTKEEELEWLDEQYGQEVEWQKSCARVAAWGQVFMGHISEVPAKEIEELEESLYQARDFYMELYRKNKQDGNPLALQNYMFGNREMYDKLDKFRFLAEESPV